MLRSVASVTVQHVQEENTLIANLTANSTANSQLLSTMPSETSAAACFLTEREDLREYVAHLQLHMALQARNLVPTLTQAADSRQQMLHQTQADFEKYVSRQAL
jgi:hypothetical protein